MYVNNRTVYNFEGLLEIEGSLSFAIGKKVIGVQIFQTGNQGGGNWEPSWELPRQGA
jgi:hypothetical protein